MGIELNVDKDAINQMMTDAILESAIGTTLREVVQNKVNELGRAFNNPIEAAVNVEVGRVLQNLVQTTFKPVIEVKVTELLTDELLSKITRAAWNSLMDAVEKKTYR